MDIGPNFLQHDSHCQSDADIPPKHNLKSISSQTSISESDNGCFDCNICLDSVHEPVVTLCGHLYCWPCIYKWLQVRNSSDEPEQRQNCPVCKTKISISSLVPLYVSGNSISDSERKKPQLGIVIPRRPTTPSGSDTTITSNPNREIIPFRPHSQEFYHQQYFPHPYGDPATNAPPYLGDVMITSMLVPAIGMFGQMVSARIFGSSNGSLFPYPYSGNGSTRMRRHEMQLDKSLNRVSIFLFCCFIVCLLLF